MFQDGRASFFKGGHRLRALNGGEIVKELRESVPALEVVKQGPKRYSSTDEDWRTAQDLWINVNR